MERLKGSKPSPAMVVSIIALVFALAGSAAAGVATISVLNKKEKKQTRNIAKDEINKAAPGLSVANASTLGGLTAARSSIRRIGACRTTLCRGQREARQQREGRCERDLLHRRRITPGRCRECASSDFRFANASAVASGCNPGEDIYVYTKTRGAPSRTATSTSWLSAPLRLAPCGSGRPVLDNQRARATLACRPLRVSRRYRSGGPNARRASVWLKSPLSVQSSGPGRL